MTRKQALQRAIEIVIASRGEEEEVVELCSVLSNISEELPLSRWTKNGIIDTYRQFYIDNGRLPTIHDTIYEKKLPVKKHITEKFGMNLTQFYQHHFPDLLQKSKDDIVKDFVQQYNQMGFPTREEYEKNRPVHSAGTNKLLSITNSKTWLELLKKCNLKSALEHRTQFDLKVHVIRPQYATHDDKMARYDEIIAAIQKIVSDHDKRIAREKRFEELRQQQNQYQ